MLKILDKPAGCTTHTSLSEDESKRLHIEPNDGFLEYLGSRSGKTLLPVHRLDIETSGVLLAVQSGTEKSQSLTSALSSALESRDVTKVYYFITDKKPRRGFTSGSKIESHISRVRGGGQSKNGPQFVSHAPTTIEPINSSTMIEHVRDLGSFSLWKAIPSTGKPHQIRLHAESVGLAILGDPQHGGSDYPSLCLHAAELDVTLNMGGDSTTIQARSQLPKWYSNLDLLSDPQLVSWLAAVERRERTDRSLRAMEVPVSETRREIHSAISLDGTDLRCDRLGEVTHFHWYGNPLKSNSVFKPDDLARIKRLADIMKCNDWYIQHRSNRGAAPGGKSQDEETALSRPELPLRWTASEEELNFQFRRDSGLSTGLFLDQRANRRWVLRQKNRRVLNLFCYTGGFSVAAAKAGSEQVVSVDLSKSFLEWTKENFKLNHLNPEHPGYEFRAMDSRDYLKWAGKKGLTFDLVICDPPSFSRSDNGVFRIEAELESLLKACADVTASDGRILFATNYEGWSHYDFIQRVNAFAQSYSRTAKKTITAERTPSPDWDFEMPREPRRMKSVFLKFPRS